MMDRELVITNYKNKILSLIYEDHQLVEIRTDENVCNVQIGDVFIGKVKNIVKNINAAFVEIEEGTIGYYSLTDNKKHHFINVKKNNKLTVGDEIIVQVSTENMKTKAIALTSNLNFTGRNVVLTANKTFIGVSGKIHCSEEKKRLKCILEPYVNEAYGFIIRTNAKNIEADTLIDETKELIHIYNQVIKQARYAVCFTKIFSGKANYLKTVRDLLDKGLPKVITDLPEVYDELKQLFPNQDILSESILKLYDDPLVSLIKLKNIETQIERALKEHVWLKSGASIVIQQTEALIAIDVNTAKYSGGKFTGKKNMEETFLKINLEAAKEIGYQIRLRNLSGIILIDFINMKNPDYQKQLIDELTKVVSKDSVKTVVLGMTKLNLIEVTRKKGQKPLHEQLGCQCPKCHGRGYLF